MKYESVTFLIFAITYIGLIFGIATAYFTESKKISFDDLELNEEK